MADPIQRHLEKTQAENWRLHTDLNLARERLAEALYGFEGIDNHLKSILPQTGIILSTREMLQEEAKKIREFLER